MTTTATQDATGTGPHRVVPANPPRRGRSRRYRAIRATLIAAVALVAAVVIAGLPLYVFPPPGDADGADLVYVIGPPRAPRIDVAEQLRGNHQSLPLLVSVSSAKSAETTFTATRLAVCHDAHVTCETPAPFTTKGEAKMLSEYAAKHTVGKTVVITFTPHVARTRYIFAKCYAGDVTVVGVDEHLSLADWIYQYAYQTVAFVKAWANPCP